MPTRAQVKQFRELVVRPTLEYLGLYSPAAENLLVGTAVHESGLSWFAQNGGPALGFFQMEPATLTDIWTNYLKFRPEIAEKVHGLLPPYGDIVNELVTGLRYATAMARLRYLRVSEPMPAAEDIAGLARYWKQHYNTPLGKGDPETWQREYIAWCQS